MKSVKVKSSNVLPHRNLQVKTGKTPPGDQASLGSITQNKHQNEQCSFYQEMGKSIFTITFVLSKNSSKHLERNERSTSGTVSQVLTAIFTPFSNQWSKPQALNKYCLISHKSESEYKDNLKFRQKSTKLLLTCSEIHPWLCHKCILGQRGAKC